MTDNTPTTQTTTPEARTLSPAIILRNQILEMKDKFAESLPSHISADKFARVALLAIQDPQMQEVAATSAGQKSIYEALLRAASDGLMPDKRDGALVKVKAKDQRSGQWIGKADWRVMVAGIMKKARNSGDIRSIVCNCVYELDTFEIDFVSVDAPVIHKPFLQGDRGQFIGVYAIAKLKDGEWTQPEWMNKAQVDAIRQRSETGRDTDRNGQARAISGPWATDFEEMARKTVIRRASKYWPSSTDKDDALGDMLRRNENYAVVDGQRVERMALPNNHGAGKMSAVALLNAAETSLIAADPIPEPDTVVVEQPAKGRRKTQTTDETNLAPQLSVIEQQASYTDAEFDDEI